MASTVLDLNSDTYVLACKAPLHAKIYYIIPASTLPCLSHMSENIIEARDGGAYCWFVVMASCYCNVFVFGFFQASGPFLVAIQKDLNLSATKTSWLLSLLLTMQMMLGPISNVTTSKCGYRVTVFTGAVLCALGSLLSSFARNVTFLYFSFSTLIGLGHALIASPSLGIVALYFDKWFAIANAIAMSGSAYGILVLNPLFQALIDNFGWQNAFIVLSGIQLQMCLCALLFKNPMHSFNSSPTTEKTGEPYVINDPNIPVQNDQYQKTTLSCKEIFVNILHMFDCNLLVKHKAFLLFSVVFGLGVGAGYQGLPAYIFMQAEFLHLASSLKISLLVSIFGVFNLVGRIATMPLKASKNRIFTSSHVFGCSLFVAGVATIISVLIDTYVLFAFYASFVGLFCGLLFPCISLLTAEYLSAEKVTAGMSIAFLWNGAGSLIGPNVAGFLYDISGNYNNSLYWYGTTMAVCGLAFLIIEPLLIQSDRNSVEEEHLVEITKTVARSSYETMKE
ncbi:monocarboxylate transporter 13-like [Ptychodera flava]|uniref:monocarboxylate transporter 13-like n=1 Tax=Ptychodera flava TaxID=63121 RepID=UPI003969DD63